MQRDQDLNTRFTREISMVIFLKKLKQPRVPKPGFGVERKDYGPLLERVRVSEKKLGVSALQAEEPTPYSVNNSPMK